METKRLRAKLPGVKRTTGYCRLKTTREREREMLAVSVSIVLASENLPVWLAYS